MLRTKTGWVAQRRRGTRFTIKGRKASGIFLSFGRGLMHLYYAGMDGSENKLGDLPADPFLLRELATALEEAADELTTRGFRPHLHMLIEAED